MLFGKLRAIGTMLLLASASALAQTGESRSNRTAYPLLPSEVSTQEPPRVTTPSLVLPTSPEPESVPATRPMPSTLTHPIDAPEEPGFYRGSSIPFSARLGLNIYEPTEPDELDQLLEYYARRAPSHVEQAAPMHLFRMRVEPQFRMNHPDRAEYFWPKNGIFQNFFRQDNAKGPIEAESRVDNVDVSFYAEVMLAPHVSVWTNIPFRNVNPEQNLNESGIGDVSAGLKWAFVFNERRAIALQCAGFFPSGEGIRGLGTENYWVQPGILWQENLTENLTLYMDVHDRMPVNPRSDFTGHVMKFGAGLSYLIDLGSVRLLPLVESVGWSILNGKQSFQLGKIERPIQNVRGLTFFDMYYGMRISLGDEATQPGGFLAMSDLFVSYGHTISGNWWFENQWRMEYRLRF